MSFDELNFTSSPNFRFQEVVSNKKDCLSTTYQFDCFQDKSGKTILIAPYFDIDDVLGQDHHISLINLKNNKVEKELKGHKDRVTIVRYFQNTETKNDYFISADRSYSVIVWDLSNDCNIIFEKELKYEGFINCALLMFIKNNMYAVVSSIGANNSTKIIDVNDKNFVREIESSKNIIMFFLEHWVNKNQEDEDKKNVIIQCGKNKIILTEFPSNNTYYVDDTDEKNPFILGGIVFKNNDRDLFAFSSSYGLIKIIDLENKTSVKSIQLEKVQLYSFVRWNERYLLINDCLQRRIIVIDVLDDYKIKSKVLCPEMNFDRFIKKIEHPIYGESILSIGIDWRIKLFVTRDIMKPKTKNS